MDKPPVMSMFATELDCLRAREKWFAARLSAAEQREREAKDRLREIGSAFERVLGPGRDSRILGAMIAEGVTALDSHIEAALASLRAQHRREAFEEAEKHADTARKALSDRYQQNINDGCSQMGGNMDWARVEGAVKAVQAIRRLAQGEGKGESNG